jgi:hypothetical protein
MNVKHISSRIVSDEYFLSLKLQRMENEYCNGIFKYSCTTWDDLGWKKLHQFRGIKRRTTISVTDQK